MEDALIFVEIVEAFDSILAKNKREFEMLVRQISDIDAVIWIECGIIRLYGEGANGFVSGEFYTTKERDKNMIRLCDALRQFTDLFPSLYIEIKKLAIRLCYKKRYTINYTCQTVIAKRA